MAPIMAVLTQTPRHHSTKFVLADNLIELLQYKFRRITRLEKAILGVGVILSAGLFTSQPVLGCQLP
jgi:hypothetical protein